MLHRTVSASPSPPPPHTHTHTHLGSIQVVYLRLLPLQSPTCSSECAFPRICWQKLREQTRKLLPPQRSAHIWRNLCSSSNVTGSSNFVLLSQHLGALSDWLLGDTIWGTHSLPGSDQEQEAVYLRPCLHSQRVVPVATTGCLPDPLP